VSDVRLTQVNEALGAKEFRPPEAELGLVEEVSPSLDVYALGKLLYWIISDGRSVIREYFDKGDADLRNSVTEQWIYPTYNILAKSIKENPNERYPSASEMLNDVDELLTFIEKDARYLDATVYQPCVFCRIGSYDFVTTPDITDGRYNYVVAGRYGLAFYDREGQSFQGRQANFSAYRGALIGICSHCGNVQQFHIEYKGARVGSPGFPSTKWKSLPEPEKY
jgi:hypothetical protein